MRAFSIFVLSTEVDKSYKIRDAIHLNYKAYAEDDVKSNDALNLNFKLQLTVVYYRWSW